MTAGGLEAVAVEPLARRLGVSKGSFYWHFANREALIKATAVRWEEIRTVEVIEALAPVTDPRERLSLLFAGAFGRPKASRLEAAFVSSRNDPSVAPVLRRVTKKRMAYLTEIFRELGFDARQSLHRANVAYGAYIGLFVMRHTNPAAVPKLNGSADTFVADLVQLLTYA
jgi:AcrR family transcriptional regulator